MMMPKIAIEETDAANNITSPDNEPITMMDLCIALARMERRAKAAEDARDMLATRCAEQAKQIQKHLIGNPYIDQAREPKQHHAALADAIAVMQRAGVR